MATRLSQYRTVAPARVDQRNAQRHAVLVSRATVSSRSARPFEARLADLSTFGCRLACETRHAEGDALLLDFPQGQPVGATVVWNDGAHIGCRFDAPIDRGLVRALTLVIC